MAQTMVQTSSLRQPSKPPSNRAPSAAVFLALLLCGLLPSQRRRKLLPFLCTAMLAMIATTLTGCGGGSKSGPGGNGTSPQPQTYNLTLKATDSVNPTITASTTFTLTINQ
jgi:hypothetical protein